MTLTITKRRKSDALVRRPDAGGEQRGGATLTVSSRQVILTPREGAPTMPRTLDRPTDRVRAISTRIAEQQARLLTAVAEARESGESWESIGRALGMSRQAAWQRFYRTVEGIRTDRGSRARQSRTDPISGSPFDEITKRLVRALHPSRLIVFGSHARGEARPDSDLDVLVVLPSIKDRHASTVAALRVLKDITQDVDVLVASEEEAETTGRIPGTVLNAALTEGRVMYDRAYP